MAAGSYARKLFGEARRSSNELLLTFPLALAGEAATLEMLSSVCKGCELRDLTCCAVLPQRTPASDGLTSLKEATAIGVV